MAPRLDLPAEFPADGWARRALSGEQDFGMAEIAAGASAEHSPISRRQLTAAIIGNVLEFYDFTTYAFFAIQIGRTFFPAGTPFISLMLSLATFGVGFAGRPIGGIVIGALGDRAGRRPAMVLSFSLMGLAILVMALTPSYAAIGWTAPAIVVTARLVQGFALGGEVGPSTAYLLEASPAARRGFFGSWQIASQGASTLAAGLVGVILANLLSPDQLQAWGWRLALLIGALALPFGLIVRRALPETLHREDAAFEVDRSDAPHAPPWRHMILGLVMLMSLTTLTYVMNYMTTFAQANLGMTANFALGATVVVGGCTLVFNLVGGAWSDRIGRKPVMVWPRIVLLLALYPAFAWLVHERSVGALLTVTALLGSLGSIGASPALVCLAEAMPRRMRSAGLAIVYACAIGLFGGATQPLVAWLIHATDNLMAPAWYLIVTTAFGILAMALMRETAPVKAGR